MFHNRFIHGSGPDTEYKQLVRLSVYGTYAGYRTVRYVAGWCYCMLQVKPINLKLSESVCLCAA